MSIVNFIRCNACDTLLEPQEHADNLKLEDRRYVTFDRTHICVRCAKELTFWQFLIDCRAKKLAQIQQDAALRDRGK